MSVPLSLAIAPVWAQAPGRDIAESVQQAILGIMSFTRWPNAPASLRLCVVGRPRHAGALADQRLEAGGTGVAVLRYPEPTGNLGALCDAIYTGELSAGDRQVLIGELAGHAILTITEGDPQCSGPSMFCLDITDRDPQVGFSVNLDSVARSGVKINPRVLLLGRRKKPAS